MHRAVCLLWVGALTIGLMSSMQALAQDLDSQDGAGAVFVMTNSVKKNEVIAYRRAADGTLREQGRFATGGRGSGGKKEPLETQSSLTRSPDHTPLFPVQGRRRP